ncbi:TIGR01906 family membrane protein [Candidatus Woesearchaeota archaeon]|nr:TIGR01906 family membrane protein [Candidatus Woesearchaeota archaeon]
MKSKILQNLIKTTLIISLILIILLTPFLFFSYNEHHYESQAKQNNIYQKLGEQTARQQNKNTINFLLGKEELKGNYTQAEKQHMQDVKNIYTTINAITTICLLIAILGIIYFTKKRQEKQIIKSLKQSSITVLLIGILILILTLLNFQNTFTAFHNIFFPQGNWQFPINSLLITLYPTQFFTDTATYSFLTSTIISLMTLTITFLPKYQPLFSSKK